MPARGRRSRKHLLENNISTADMTPAEYRRSDTPGTYEVTTARGTKIKVSGLHSAKAVAGKDGTFKKVR